MRFVKLGAIAISAIAPFLSLSAQNSSPAAAPRPAPFDLTIDNIMRGPDLYGTPPRLVRFSDDSRYGYFRWKKPEVDTAEASYRVAVTGGEPERMASPADSLYPQNGVWSRDRRAKAYLFRGDVYRFDAVRGQRRRLTDTPGAEGNVQLPGDGRTVYFVRDNNVYGISLDGGPAQQRRLFEFVRPASASGPRSLRDPRRFRHHRSAPLLSRRGTERPVVGRLAGRALPAPDGERPRRGRAGARHGRGLQRPLALGGGRAGPRGAPGGCATRQRVGRAALVAGRMAA